MNTDPNHDEVIDIVLAALRSATPPEGMEARIASRIACEAAAPTPGPSRLASLVPSASWWGGAVTGAATVLLILGICISVGHLAARNRNLRSAVATSSDPRHSMPHAAAVSYSASLDPSRHPCLRQSLLPATLSAPASIPGQFVAQTPIESNAPSHPAPELPLTPQERELAHLVRTTDPRQLAALGRGEQARLEAERASELSKYFAQPTPAPTSDAAPSASVAPTAPAPMPEAPANPAVEATAPTQSADQPTASDTNDQTPSANKKEQK